MWDIIRTVRTLNWNPEYCLAFLRLFAGLFQFADFYYFQFLVHWPLQANPHGELLLSQISEGLLWYLFLCLLIKHSVNIIHQWFVNFSLNSHYQTSSLSQKLFHFYLLTISTTVFKVRNLVDYSDIRFKKQILSFKTSSSIDIGTIRYNRAIWMYNLRYYIEGRLSLQWLYQTILSNHSRFLWFRQKSHITFSWSSILHIDRLYLLITQNLKQIYFHPIYLYLSYFHC